MRKSRYALCKEFQSSHNFFGFEKHSYFIKTVLLMLTQNKQHLYLNELIKKYLSSIIIYIRISYKRRKILDFAVMNNNSSLVVYLYFLYLPWYCLFFLFLNRTLNVDFGNKTNTWISKCFCLWFFYCLGISSQTIDFSKFLFVAITLHPRSD